MHTANCKLSTLTMDTFLEEPLSSSAYDDDVNNANTNNMDADVLRDRLNKVRKAVRKATQEAWKQADGHNPSLSTLQKENASFLLGMDLFGSGGVDIDGGGGSGNDSTMMSTSSGLERAIRDKLVLVEYDLERIQKESNNSITASGSESNNIFPSNEGGEEFEAESTDNLDIQIENYKRKVAFLKQASLARSCLEESAALSSSALSKEAPDNLVRSGQTLLRALGEVDEAERILLDDSSSTESSEQQKEIEVAYRILSSLRHQIRRHRVELVHRAGTVLDGSIELTSTSIAVKSSAQLAVAYRVLETLDENKLNKTKTTALQETLRGFTSRLFEEALKPILTLSDDGNSNDGSSRRWKVEETADKRSTMMGVSTGNRKGTSHRIEWSSLGADENNDEEDENNAEEVGGKQSSFAVINSWKNILGVFQKILHFVESKVFLERETLCNLVGNRLFGTPDAMPGLMNLSALGLESTLLGENDQGVLMEAMVEWLRDQCLSDDVIEENDSRVCLDRVVSLREELLECTLPFCQELQDRHLIPQNPPPRLVVFCQDFEKTYVEHRRCIRLNQARDILIENDYHNTVVVGVEENPSPDDLQEAALAIFRLSRCSISDSSDKLMTLVRQTMDESVAVSTTVSQDSPLAMLRPTLYKTAREMFSLFSAIIPANHGREVANVPRTAAVLHNDSVFLAHHCLTLGLEYKEKFPQVDEDDARGKLLKQTCIFVDMVPLFRELADSSLNDMLDLQKHQLAEIVGGRITYFGQALRSDESVHEWSEAETALAAGIYHLRHLAQAWKSILSTPVFLRSMGYLADVVFALYLKEVTSARSISGSARQFTGTLFRKATVEISGLLDAPQDPYKYALQWGRFEAAGNFLELDQLAQVEQALSSGVFRHVESQELARLIQATYNDSPHRKSLLNGMASVV
jgi:hypothetical protein